MHYAKIKHWDIANGEGVRISLFVSGCNFHCKDCFNPEAWDFNYGEEYTIETHNELLKLLANDHIDGLSLLGGDPLWQSEEDIYSLCALCDEVHHMGKTVWLWSGFTFEQIMEKGSISQKDLLKSCDVYVDGKFEVENKDLKLLWRGSTNQRVIDVKESLQKGQLILYGTN